MITVNVNQTTDKIYLGRRGETEARVIVFDVSDLIESYGEGTATLLAKRQGDSDPYPVNTVQSDSSVAWTISDSDSAVSGYGQCELFWYVGDTLAKSIIWQTWTDPDIGTEGEVPQPYESWVQEVIDAAQLAEESAVEAAQSVVEAQEVLASAVKVDSNGKFYI